jgi:hypothetical protein
VLCRFGYLDGCLSLGGRLFHFPESFHGIIAPRFSAPERRVARYGELHPLPSPRRGFSRRSVGSLRRPNL